MARSFCLCFRRRGATDVHGTPVVLLSGDEWKTDRRLSIQPRAVLLRRGELSRKGLVVQVESELLDGLGGVGNRV